jgi:aryl-alcohol dehydrogenase-like predicted oxidoreductase
MKQETLEEVAERYSANELSQLGFINGAKWQQEQDKNKNSLEDMKKAFEDGQENMDYSEMYGWSSKLTTEEWFEQFKKK